MLAGARLVGSPVGDEGDANSSASLGPWAKTHGADRSPQPNRAAGFCLWAGPDLRRRCWMDGFSFPFRLIQNHTCRSLTIRDSNGSPRDGLSSKYKGGFEGG